MITMSCKLRNSNLTSSKDKKKRYRAINVVKIAQMMKSKSNELLLIFLGLYIKADSTRRFS